MIEYKQGDILQDHAEALVNTVNCMGIMGRGIALQFKKAFPANYKAYYKACQSNLVHPGKVFVFDTQQSINPHYIINFPTKRHWRSQSRIEDIDAGLQSLVGIIKKYNISSIAIPPLGSGLGGLDWQKVKSHIEIAFQRLECIQIIIYEPIVESANVMSRSDTIPTMTAGRATLIGLINRYLQGLLDPTVTLLVVHKLMYFMQETGEPLKLHYCKGHYGPYADNLRHVLKAINGTMIEGYIEGDRPENELNLIPGIVAKALNFLQQQPIVLARFERVASLLEGFESPFGLELLSTVHWLITREKMLVMDEIIQGVHKWNTRKKQRFTPRQIGIAVDTLVTKGWVANLEAV